MKPGLDQKSITLNEGTPKELKSSQILVATLLSDGTVFISCTTRPRKYLSDLSKDFSALSPVFIQLEQFPNADADAAKVIESKIHGWRDPRERPGTAIFIKRCLYQWRYRFSIMGAKIINRQGGNAYVVSTPGQQAASGASETLFHWLELDARNIVPCPEILAWAERCGLTVPTWVSFNNEKKREQLLSIMGNPKNYDEPFINSFIMYSFQDEKSNIIAECLSEGVMAICVNTSRDENEVTTTIFKMKRKRRQSLNDESADAGDIDEESGEFHWKRRDLSRLRENAGALGTFDPARFGHFLNNIFFLAIFSIQNNIKEDGGEEALSLLSDVIPDDSILVVFCSEDDGETVPTPSVWFF